MKNKEHKNSRKGFTLIEALVAMGMIAILLPILMQGYSLSLRMSSDAKHRTQAASLARAKLEELMTTQAWQTDQLSGDFGTDWPEYRWSGSVQPWNNGVMNQLSVQVQWTARQQQKNVTVTSLVQAGSQ